MFGQEYSNKNYQAQLVKCRTDAACDYIGDSSTLVHANVVFRLETLDLKRATFVATVLFRTSIG